MTKAFKFGLLLFLFFLSACANEEPKNYTILYEEDIRLYDLIVDANGWIASGGITFELGVVIQSKSNNEEQGLRRDSLFDKSILCLDTLGGVLAAGGIYSISNDVATFWNVQQTPELYFLNDLILEDNRMISVGGAGLSTGILYEWNRDLTLRRQQSFEQELSCILRIDNRYLIGGYGFLQETVDFQSWKSLLDQDDHYIDLEMEDEIIFALGASGRVLQSEDFGENWEQIRNPGITSISEAKDLHIANGLLYLAEGNNIYKTPLKDIDWVKHGFDDLGEINKISSFENSITFVTLAGEVAQFID